MTNTVPAPHALLPLTAFDEAGRDSLFVTGWLVEGLIDTAALGAALGRLAEKWRMLAGRVEPVKGPRNVRAPRLPLSLTALDADRLAPPENTVAAAHPPRRSAP